MGMICQQCTEPIQMRPKEKPFQFKCVQCGNSKSGNIQAHHIKEYSKYPELRYDIDNGMTVCIDCHKEIHYGKS